MTEKIIRNYLEICSLENFKEVQKPSENYSIELLNPKDFQLNKFFYKNVGKEYQWVDRLVWTEQNWIDYVSKNNLLTYILKDNNEIAGYFELFYHLEKKETELAYFGILTSYFGKKLGGYLLSYAIKKSFLLDKNLKRVWVHTCSLDHPNALFNYISRGMKIFKKEEIKIK